MRNADPAGARSGDRAKVPPAPGDPAAIGSLTSRECEVLLALSTAAPNRLIGRRLGIAERTVKAHLTSIMAKIHVRSRTEAALFAYAHHRRIARSAAAQQQTEGGRA
ncbi:LuxR C-terminal-related transcriptional regulator [Streptomyces sp. NPDC005435]|uniref:response regulator transcription factor n=1 Tax=Streptomyces sp. NPDC005435 TaxID=3154464 RepID=UPI003456B9C9